MLKKRDTYEGETNSFPTLLAQNTSGVDVDVVQGRLQALSEGVARHRKEERT